MMLAQVAQIPIQLFDPLFVRLGAFALQPFVELYEADELLAMVLRAVDDREGEKHTLFRLRSSCLSSASVLPARVGGGVPFPISAIAASPP